MRPQMSTRAIKRLPRAQQAEKARAKRAFAAAGDGGGAGEEGARRARLNAALRGGAPALLVADAAATRGLHFDAVGRVYILGLPANADTYLHLAGRTGRWPRPSRDEGDATVVTIATEDELRTLRGWSNGLGGVEFSSV
jgi:superfamily II DNA/RNA helicase